MKPFVIEPQEGELKVCVAYSANAHSSLEKQIAVIGGDEFLVRLFSNWLLDVQQLGPIHSPHFVPGKLYTWRGHVCVLNGQILSAEGAWTWTELFQPKFNLEKEKSDGEQLQAEAQDD